jgi:hypothetical protein
MIFLFIQEQNFYQNHNLNQIITEVKESNNLKITILQELIQFY